MTASDLACVPTANAEFPKLFVEFRCITHRVLSLHIANPIARENVSRLGNDALTGCRHNADMAGRKKIAQPTNRLRAWREYRKLTQEALAEKVGTSKGVISQLENSRRGLSDKWAYRLAPHLGIRAGWLRDYNPEDIPHSVVEIFADIPDERKPQALAILETFRRRKSP